MNKKTLMKLIWAGGLLVVALLVYFLLPKFKADVSITVSDKEDTIYEQASGFKKLEQGQLAYISSGTPITKTENSSVIQYNGKSIDLPTKNTLFLPTSKNMSGYIGSDSRVKFLNTSISASESTSKVSSSVEQKLKTDNKVRIIIKFKTNKSGYEATSSTADNAKINTETIKIGDQLNSLMGQEGKVTTSLSIIDSAAAIVTKEGLDKIRFNENVESISEDKVVKAYLDTSAGQIKADEAWGTVSNGSALTGKGIRIAIIDTGVDYTHADLGGCLGANCKVAGGYDFVNADNDPMDDQGHGTHVAATAAGNGLLKGIAPDATIFAYKVLNQDGAGYVSDIIQSIQKTADPNGDGNTSDHFDIASLSLGGEGDPNDPSSKAVDKASALGVTFTIAAGNSGPFASTIGSPGTARTAITVAAACSEAQSKDITNLYCYGQRISSFSSRGPVFAGTVDLKKPELSAPGVLICAARFGTAFGTAPTCFDNQHVRISGTSMATPHVAGAAALIKQANPTFTPAMIKSALIKTATTLGEEYDLQGAGLINTKAAIGKDSIVTSNPATLSLETSPLQKIFTKTENLVITSSDKTISALSAEINLPNSDGIKLELSAPSIILTSGAGKISYLVEVDNDIATGGIRQGSISLKNGSTLLGLIPISINVKSVFDISKNSIDFGNNNPNLPSWSSDEIEVTLTNSRQDVDQKIEISSNITKARLRITDSSKTEITNVSLAPNSSATIKLQLIVEENTALNIGAYSGKIKFINQGDSEQTIDYKFIKYYVLNINNVIGNKLGANVAANWVTIYDTKMYTYYSEPIKTGANQILMKTPGPYDIGAFLDSYETSAFFFELKERTEAGANVTIDLAKNAKNQVTTEFKDETGKSITNEMYDQSHAICNSDRQCFYLVMSFFGGVVKDGTIFVSDMSDRFSLFVSGQDEPSAKKGSRHSFAFTQAGINENINFVTKPENNTKSIFKFDFTKTIKDPISVGVSLPVCVPDSSMSWLETTNNASMDSLTLYANRPAGYFSSIISNMYPDGTCNSNPASNAKCGTVYESPLIDPVAKQAKLGPWSDTFDYDTNNINIGLGPVLWGGRFENTTSGITVVSNMGREYPPTDFFQRQGNVAQILLSQGYVLNKNQKKAYSGKIPSRLMWYSGLGEMDKYEFFLNHASVAKGLYTFVLNDFTYKINGIDAVAKVSAEFDLNRTDPNPPFIKDLRLVSDNQPLDDLVEGKPATIKFSLDPNVGEMESVSLKLIKKDSSTVDLNISSQESNLYIADLAQAIEQTEDSGNLTLIMKAVDDSKNLLNYQFQIPLTKTAVTPNPEIENLTDVHSYKNIKNAVTAKTKNGSKFAWSKKSGPADLIFENADKQDATIKATVPGKYEVDFSAENGTKKAAKTLNFIIHKSGDINNDGVIDELDFASMLGNWGTPKNAMADYNRDNTVDELDFATLLTNWNK
jgi:subtilisin family serine protease